MSRTGLSVDCAPKLLPWSGNAWTAARETHTRRDVRRLRLRPLQPTPQQTRPRGRAGACCSAGTAELVAVPPSAKVHGASRVREALGLEQGARPAPLPGHPEWAAWREGQTTRQAISPGCNRLWEVPRGPGVLVPGPCVREHTDVGNNEAPRRRPRGPPRSRCPLRSAPFPSPWVIGSRLSTVTGDLCPLRAGCTRSGTVSVYRRPQ